MDKLILVTVYRSQGMLPAQVVKAKLESAGVPVALKYESVGQVMGFTVDGLGLVEVQVPLSYAAAAAELVSEADDASENDQGATDVDPEDFDLEETDTTE